MCHFRHPSLQHGCTESRMAEVITTLVNPFFPFSFKFLKFTRAIHNRRLIDSYANALIFFSNNFLVSQNFLIQARFSRKKIIS